MGQVGREKLDWLAFEQAKGIVALRRGNPLPYPSEHKAYYEISYFLMAGDD